MFGEQLALQVTQVGDDPISDSLTSVGDAKGYGWRAVVSSSSIKELRTQNRQCIQTKEIDGRDLMQPMWR
jgi:hypothetical protein